MAQQDPFHEAFLRDIFPSDWVNPEPKKEYDLVVVGAGPGGMTAHAGDMICQVGVAMQSPDGLKALSQAIHPFPTQSQVLRSCAETLLQHRVPNRVHV